MPQAYRMEVYWRAQGEGARSNGRFDARLRSDGVCRASSLNGSPRWSWEGATEADLRADPVSNVKGTRRSAGGSYKDSDDVGRSCFCARLRGRDRGYRAWSDELQMEVPAKDSFSIAEHVLMVRAWAGQRRAGLEHSRRTEDYKDSSCPQKMDSPEEKLEEPADQVLAGCERGWHGEHGRAVDLNRHLDVTFDLEKMEWR